MPSEMRGPVQFYPTCNVRSSLKPHLVYLPGSDTIVLRSCEHAIQFDASGYTNFGVTELYDGFPINRQLTP